METILWDDPGVWAHSLPTQREVRPSNRMQPYLARFFSNELNVGAHSLGVPAPSDGDFSFLFI